ncbi:MAG: hypothetical protein B7Y36_09330 [Novosphingobium sp. 28-62-57]|uniref:hypothetical protein n=1 Tax=unclassified Novosphingobium TaxID=2644732 RepID=UPI000BCF601D|nr:MULTISPECIES: hypothetical protein [unclassified Novosphingobium]OYW51452.1 MAG: hypothetical protein B7Z34_01250 [Novosphingobium sp. 12-62-10]OYZ10413.1 MAG: hypothetical protein B7Y36_09330 [Novosphingobium sp. 28-62-57]OZA40708.1 MAG: hypothetical protein B7X92_00625 [Novosphingobium sp. 17-62-9]HQS68186.1 hypothetical protein [Novosphingobium sp.]
MATTAPRAGLSMGHIALHYPAPADGPLAARLLAQMGLTESQMLPLPGGNFYRFVVSPDHVARGDGIVFLSCLPEPQARLIAAIRAALNIGTDAESEAVTAYRAMMAQDFEASFHFGLLMDSLEDLEAMVLNLQDLAANDPDLKGRLTIGMNRARPGDAEIDARLDASPVFGQVKRYAYGAGGVQVFVETDLVCAGQLGESMVFEFDYVFPDKHSHILSVVEL